MIYELAASRSAGRSRRDIALNLYTAIHTDTGLVPLLEHHAAHLPHRRRAHAGGRRARARHGLALPAAAAGAPSTSSASCSAGSQVSDDGADRLARRAARPRLRGLHGRRGPRDLSALHRRASRWRCSSARRRPGAVKVSLRGEGRRAGQPDRGPLRRRRPRERRGLHAAGHARRRHRRPCSRRFARRSRGAAVRSTAERPGARARASSPSRRGPASRRSRSWRICAGSSARRRSATAAPSIPTPPGSCPSWSARRPSSRRTSSISTRNTWRRSRLGVTTDTQDLSGRGARPRARCPRWTRRPSPRALAPLRRRDRAGAARCTRPSTTRGGGSTSWPGRAWRSSASPAA